MKIFGENYQIAHKKNSIKKVMDKLIDSKLNKPRKYLIHI